MRKTFFIGDTHFGGFPGLNIEDGRPKIMTAIKMWNDVVGKNDIVFHLGDVANPEMPSNVLMKTIASLNGIKYLIMGNHDRDRSTHFWRAMGFEQAYDHPIILKNFVIVCHEPLFITPNMPYLMAFAHVHDNPAYVRENNQVKNFSANVIGWKPAEWDLYNKLK